VCKLIFYFCFNQGFGDRLLAEIRRNAPREVKIRVSCGDETAPEEIRNKIARRALLDVFFAVFGNG